MTGDKQRDALRRTACLVGMLVACFVATLNVEAAVDRTFLKALNLWISGETADQLAGFTMLCLDSDNPDRYNRYKQVTNTLSKKLIIALTEPGAYVDTTMYPDAALAAYADSSGPLKRFDAWLDTLKDSTSVAAMYYNLEMPASRWEIEGVRDSFEVAYAHARMLRQYKEILTRNGMTTTQFWVYSAPHNDNNTEVGQYSCSWDSLTSGAGAIDVCFIGGGLNVVCSVEDQATAIRNDIDLTHGVANGKKIAWHVMTYGVGDEQNDYTYIRNNYHRNWSKFRQIIHRIKSMVDSVNNGDGSIDWWQGHYKTGSPYYSYGYNAEDTSPPAGDLPWNDGGNYPARLFDEGYMWQWNHTVNQWEAEFLANFLAGSGYTMPSSSKEITGSVYWGKAGSAKDTVVVIGDIEVKGALTIYPGTLILFRNSTDLHAAGEDTTLAEIIVSSGGTLSADASGDSTITFRKADPDSIGNWYGIRNLGGTVTLKNCDIQDAKIGVVASSGSTTIEDCDITDCTQGIMALTPTTVKRTEIWNASAGIQVDLNDEGMMLQNELIHDNTTHSVYAESSPYLDLENCTIADSYYGILLDNDDQMEIDIRNCIIADNTSGLTEYGAPVVLLNYSNVYGNTYPFAGDSLGTWSNPPNDREDCEGNIASDPLFEDADYHLDDEAPSPCINTGDPTMYDADELRIDMGCYGGEYPRTGKPAVLAQAVDPDLPDTFSVAQNAPNPFNPETTITYSLPEASHVTLKIYSVLGQVVRVLVNDVVPAGQHQAVWDGRDAFGRQVSSGVYIYQMKAGKDQAIRRMLVLK